jgi:hypothetical protein
LLERLPTARGMTLELGVRLGREVSHEYVRHASIVLSPGRQRKTRDLPR